MTDRTISGFNRRAVLGALGAAPLLVTMPAFAQPPTPRRMLLNSGYSGAQSWFFLAEDNGHMRRAGVRLDYTPGRGAYTAAPRLASEGFDVAFGDIYSMIEVVANAPRDQADDLPIAVYAMFNRTPSMVAVNAAGPIDSPRALVGRRVVGHASDVALETFPALASSIGIDPAMVDAGPRDATMGAMLSDMLAGEVDGVFGYVTTATAHAAATGLALDRLRFLRFADHLPDFYGHALMVRRRLVREDPAFVSGLVRAINLGLADTVRDPDSGIAAIVRRDPEARPDIERGRLMGTLTGDMGHPEAARIGIGAVDPDRLRRSIRLHATTKRLPRVPELAEIFTPDFLPPATERVTSVVPGTGSRSG